jgi:TatD DNase family protein
MRPSAGRGRSGSAWNDLVKHPKVIAVGEIGLDYHYDFSPRDVQKSVFIEQMADRRARPQTDRDPYARSLGRHARALERALGAARYRRDHALLLGRSGGGAAGPRSRFLPELRRHRHLSQSAGRSEAARAAPRDRILLETDAPYLAPVPKRGKRNEPALIVHTAAKAWPNCGAKPSKRSAAPPPRISNN